MNNEGLNPPLCRGVSITIQREFFIMRKRGAKNPIWVSAHIRLLSFYWHCMEYEVMEMYDGFIQLFALEVFFVTALSDGRGVALSSCQSENRDGSLP